MRLFYNLLTYLLLIPYACFWVFRGLRNPLNLKQLEQRFGFGFPEIDECIWVHAVSVGEVQAAVPLIRLLTERYPSRQLLITTVTTTGKQRVDSLFGDVALHSFIPFEFPHAVRNFYRSTNPSAALIMETEIWPNLYRGCGIRNIPLILVSARISPRSLPGYRKLLPLIRETLSHGIIIAAQSQPDADRFLSLGANPARTRVTGNIKFDVELNPEVAKDGRTLRAELVGGRPVWIAASTHEGEEQSVLAAHRALLEKFPELLLILVPRHPERFADVRALIEKSGFAVVSRTDGIAVPIETPVFLGNTMGEVPLFYAMSDVVFVGGSLVPVGGHNLLEPAAQGLPIITGPHLFNAQDIADMFASADAFRVVRDSDELADTITGLLTDASGADQLGDRALALLAKNRGALKRLFALLRPLLESKPA